MIDLLKLETFRRVPAAGSFTRAAAEIGCCQATVTQHIKALERELKVRLFVRRRFSNGVVLTAAGRCMLEYAARILALADEAQQAARAHNGPPERAGHSL